MMKKSFQFILVVAALSSAQEQELGSIEKDLPHANLYRSSGDWILRAVSDRNQWYSRSNIKVNGNKVWRKIFMGSKLIAQGELMHIPDSKTIEAVTNWNGKEIRNKQIYFHQDAKVIVLVTSGGDQATALKVLVKNSAKDVDNEHIRKILTQLMTEPNIRRFLEELVVKLEYINKDQMGMDFLKSEFPIRAEALVNADLIRATGTWNLRAVNDISYGFTTLENRLDFDRVVVNIFNGTRPVCTGSWSYHEDTNIIVSNMFIGGRLLQFPNGLLYADEDMVFMFAQQLHKEHNMFLVWSRNEKPFDKEFAKRLIEKNILYDLDFKHAVKEPVAKLVWLV